MKALWKDTVIAQSDDIVVVEGNHYFPIESANRELLVGSQTTTLCPWKGTASYYSIRVGADENRDAAWYYASPKDAAKQIEGRIAFWKGVKVVP